MKIDRLLEIIIIMLNRDTVSAKMLAEHFKVSVRTIQRDMVSITFAGIPVYSVEGKKGGYSILPEYKMNSHFMKPEERQLIVKALESLATSYSNESLESLIEKYNLMVNKREGDKVFWDFSVTKENSAVQTMNIRLEKAIAEKRIVKFHYRNADGKASAKTIQPLAIHYKWYAWYLFSWSLDVNEYRTYKVARISDLQITENLSVIEHGDIKKLMKESEKAYYQTCGSIEIHFEKETIGLMEEYFPDCRIEHIINNEYRLFLNVPYKERLWKALLLSFGSKVKVAAPEEYKQELKEIAKEFLSNYDI
ncbi:helix-turn-helix transcriptional regulator [Clostridium oryzae]|nr:YafY family protein [Clostridium oryzae]